MKTSRNLKLKRAFDSYGISLQANEDFEDKFHAENSVTNQFIQVEDMKGVAYIVRKNGKLWPPYTRENEAYNLEQVQNQQINHTVICHNNEFQICKYDLKSTSFDKLDTTEKTDNLKLLAEGIKKYHRISTFKNDYRILDTLSNSYQRVPSKTQEPKTYYQLIMDVAAILNSDTNNKVFSHNDLLPSSVYFKNDVLSVVDWEYSGENHRSYDLALFSLKSLLTPQQEKKLLLSYDPDNELDMHYSVTLMKPVINFLLLNWYLSSKNANSNVSILLVSALISNVQEAMMYQTARNQFFEMRLSFFSQNNDRVKKMEQSLNSEITFNTKCNFI